MVPENPKAAGPNPGLEKALELIAAEAKSRTGFLDLGNLGLTEIPDELFALSHLESLNLGTYYRDNLGNYDESRNKLGPNLLSSA